PVARLERFADPPMHPHAAVRRQFLVQRGTYEGVRERVAADGAGHLAHDRGDCGLVERVEQLVARRATRGLDGREVERRTDHGGDGEGSICGLRKTREPTAE